MKRKIARLLGYYLEMQQKTGEEGNEEASSAWAGAFTWLANAYPDVKPEGWEWSFLTNNWQKKAAKDGTANSKL